MEFDMGRAWNDAMALLRANKDVVLIVGAVFFFLPYLAFMLLMPDAIAMLSAPGASQSVDPSQAMDQAMEQMVAAFDQVKWYLIGLMVLQGIGMLGLLALLTDRSRPTVGQALAIGAKCLVPYIIAQFLMGLVMGLLLILPIIIGVGVSPIIGIVLGLLGLVLLCYVMTKFSLLAPVIAIERTMNPVAALRRSWQLTKGNSIRLFFFYVLLLIVAMVISIVVAIVVGLFTAIGGETVALIVNGFVNGLYNMIVAVLFLAVLAATHKQLAGPSGEAVGETFD